MISLPQQESLRATVRELLEQGMLKPVVTDFASPFVIVKKIDGIDRVCIDYRELNKMTERDIYPLPVIHSSMQHMKKFRVFSKIDLLLAYHQIRVSPESEKYTSFRCMYGTYKYKVIPFVTTNPPSNFQRELDHVLREKLNTKVFVYLDDILIARETMEGHHQVLDWVPTRLTDFGF
jgi:Reverse transcriptase (RNA-dependent DNA polymerase)